MVCVASTLIQKRIEIFGKHFVSRILLVIMNICFECFHLFGKLVLSTLFPRL